VHPLRHTGVTRIDGELWHGHARSRGLVVVTGTLGELCRVVRVVGLRKNGKNVKT